MSAPREHGTACGRGDRCRGFTPDAPFDVARDCRLCWLDRHHEHYRGRFVPDDPARRRYSLTVRRDTPCIHLGTPTGPIHVCPSCSDKPVAEHECAAFGTCVRTPALRLVPDRRKEWHPHCCLICRTYEPVEPSYPTG